MKELQNNIPLQEEPFSKVEYELKKSPSWYVQGSYVLDKIFKKNFSRDIDIFLPTTSARIPDFKENKFKHVIDELPEHFYFPPKLGFYNTDKYLLTENGIIVPKGFPEKPESVDLLDDNLVGILEVVKGIKTSLRYNLPPTENSQATWKKVLREEFDPAWMKQMMFDSEDEVKQYIVENIESETSEAERVKVLEAVESILEKKLR